MLKKKYPVGELYALFAAILLFGACSDPTSPPKPSDPVNQGMVGIRINPPPDPGKSLDITGITGTPVIYKNEGTSSVTLQISNGAEYALTWYVDGSLKKTGNNIMVNAADYALGKHWILLVAKKDDITWSSSPQAFIVQLKPSSL